MTSMLPLLTGCILNASPTEVNTRSGWVDFGELFLRARRAELSPEQVGLPAARGSRRVQGLRREEVAQLAMISTDYYTRLEQGG